VGAKGSEGEAILWGEELGARFGNLGSYQGYATVLYPPRRVAFSWTTIEEGRHRSEWGRRALRDESVGLFRLSPLWWLVRKRHYRHFSIQIRHRHCCREPWFKGGA